MSVNKLAKVATALALLVSPLAAEAAEIKVICAGGIGPVVTALAPEFEKASGHKIVFTFVSGPVVQREVDKGAAFDVAISLPDVIEALIKSGKIAPGSRADIARTGVGVSVRAGAPKPDISTVDAFKQTLLKAKSIAHSKEGASGVYFMGLLDRLGILGASKAEADRLAARRRRAGVAGDQGRGRDGGRDDVRDHGAGRRAGGADPERIAELGGIRRRCQRRLERGGRGSALIKFLTAPGAVAAIKAKGMEPLGK